MARVGRVALAVLCFFGCATHRWIVPSISESPRQGVALRSPLRIALLDARSEKRDSEEVVDSLSSDLSSIYGDALSWVPYFEETPEGEVALRIRLMACGADFGSRLVTATAIGVASTRSSAWAETPWGPVVASGTSNRTVLANAFSAEGWWVGTAWLELEIDDRRFAEGERISFPIIAENRQSNLWGYPSGDEAAERAWGAASQTLVRVLDNIVVAIRDQETP